METVFSLFGCCFGKGVLPYTDEQINPVMIDFIMGQLPEQSLLSKNEEYTESFEQYDSVDMFFQIFGEPRIKNLLGDNYLLYYKLKDKKTLVISICARAYDNNEVKINDYSVY